MILHTYFRSSASYRVRIALAIKGIAYDASFVNLREGEQKSEDFLRSNPQGLVPVLFDQEAIITQSGAILEYLEEVYPHPPLLPKSPIDRACVRSIAHLIACEIHPLNNLRVLAYLKDQLHITEQQKQQWYEEWIHEGFRPLEKILHKTCGMYCFGDQMTLADIYLVPQVYNAKRFQYDLSNYPLIRKIYAHCLEHPAFQEASPENQPDAF